MISLINEAKNGPEEQLHVCFHYWVGLISNDNRVFSSFQFHKET